MIPYPNPHSVLGSPYYKLNPSQESIPCPPYAVADPEGGGGDVRLPPPLKRERGGRSSVPLLSISAFIHSPVKCNQSLYIFTRCIVLLVYLITFELLNQKTK